MSRRGYLRHQMGRFLQVGRQSGWEVAIARAMESLQVQWKQNKESWQRKPGCTYAQWILQHEGQDQPSLAGYLEHTYRFSILLPVYELHADWIADTVASLAAQTLPSWELILLVAGSCAERAAEWVPTRQDSVSPIRLEVMDPWRSSAAALNAGLERCTGEYCIAISQGDMLASNALLEFAALLAGRPDVDIIYFDEDQCMDHGSKRIAPWFKPGAFSPALLLSVNYLAHAAIRRELIGELGGYDQHMEPAHEWDMLFRCVEKTQQIAHIAKVLYHARGPTPWRVNNAIAGAAVWQAEQRSVLAHLSRQEPLQRSYAALRTASGALRLKLPVTGKRVSIIIPTKDRLDLIRVCIGSILESTRYPDYEVIIVDTGSEDANVLAYYRSLEGDQRIRLVVYPGRFNYSAANNLGAQTASGDHFVFLNNDTRITHPDWLEELVGWAEQPGVGVVGAKLIRPDGTIQHAGMLMGLAGHSSHVFDGCREPVDGPYGRIDWYRNYLAVTGACMLVSRQVFEQLGGFDAIYQIGYSDIEFCLRAVRAGYQVVYTPFAELVHDEGGTRGLALPPADVLRGTLHFLPVLRSGDPFYNPNLSTLSRQPVPACEGEETRLKHVARILSRYGLVNPAVEEDASFDRFPDDGWLLLPLADLAGRRDATTRRLLLVSHDFSLSGAPGILFKLAVSLQQRGYEMTVVSPADGQLRRSYLDEGIDARVEPLILEDARLAVESILEHDLLLANTILSWRAIHAARALGKPSLWWIHEAEAGSDQARFDEHIASAFPAAWKVVFPAAYTAAMYAPLASGDNFVTVPIGVTIDPQVRMRRQPPRQHDGKFTLLSVGSIEPRKGQDILIAALVKLPPDIRQRIACTFIGRVLNPAYRDKLARDVRRNQLENVDFTGELPPQEVQAYLHDCDVFVLPSRSEALPGALLEAMAQGKAVIAASVGGVPEVLDGDNGLTFPAGDVRVLADLIAALFADRSELARLGDKARQTIQERFTFDAFADRMLTLVQEGLNLTIDD